MFISILGKLAILGAIAYILLCFAIYIWQNRLIFVPTQELTATPKAYKFDYQEVWLPVPVPKSCDRLHGWWIETPQTPTKTLLLLHGNGENISENLDRAAVFQRLGLQILLIDYRGYGRSEGKFPTEAQVYEDAAIAFEYLVTERQIAPQDIIVYGHSLGGAIAIDLAQNHPHLAGLIVESSFTSMRAMADFLGGIYNFLPIDWILHQHFNSMAKLPHLSLPILYIHGTQDRVVPYTMSQTLYEATSGLKKLLIVPQADHNNVAEMGRQDYVNAIAEFIEMVRDRQLSV
ncbi:MAG: alpha/beta hydrolase [Jaaginema sp. PMC 1079.18]|nr:alpha/beta hydrolase [Jaaginema sp. PMC 1080.18]MEC4849986.1 alpha/beta hydrolase [Jaaginema sp. PMC 1079.18]MEC4865184.1 alpha/beta hydrolase [Jaaginema sp. PMC 1078.18]